jgi:hypothetical protein
MMGRHLGRTRRVESLSFQYHSRRELRRIGCAPDGRRAHSGGYRGFTTPARKPFQLPVSR